MNSTFQFPCFIFIGISIFTCTNAFSLNISILGFLNFTLFLFAHLSSIFEMIILHSKWSFSVDFFEIIYGLNNHLLKLHIFHLWFLFRLWVLTMAKTHKSPTQRILWAVKFGRDFSCFGSWLCSVLLWHLCFTFFCFYENQSSL